MVKVIYVPVQSLAMVREIDGTVESFAELVRGEPESTPLDERRVLFFPESSPLPFQNFCIDGLAVFGDVFIARYDDVGEIVDVTSADIEEYFEVFQRPVDRTTFPWEA